MTVVTTVDSQITATHLRHSPLEHRADEFAASSVHGARGVRLGAEPFLTQVNIRVLPDGPAIAEVERALQHTLPPKPNRVDGDETEAVLWLGPDEWLVIAPDGHAQRVLGAAREALGAAFGSSVDVSANRTTLRLAGPAAREVLEKLCSVDLHPRAFGQGCCAQTLLGRTQAVVWQLSAEPAYRLMVRCSFAEYTADLLLDAMAEFMRP